VQEPTQRTTLTKHFESVGSRTRSGVHEGTYEHPMSSIRIPVNHISLCVISAR
jgi:hypothetical protein